MKKIFLLATPLLLLFISCQKTDYETVVKDDDFRSTISSGNFVELSNGYTYYELANDNKEKTPTVPETLSTLSEIDYRPSQAFFNNDEMMKGLSSNDREA